MTLSQFGASVLRMTWGFIKRFRFGPFSLNLSKRGLSGGLRLGPFSTNTRTRRLRIRGPFGTYFQTRGKKW